MRVDCSRRMQAGALAKSAVNMPMFDARGVVYLAPGLPVPADLGRDWPQQLVRMHPLP